MTAQVELRAFQTNIVIGPDDLLVGRNSRFAFTTRPTVDPRSNAINNVRFACTGRAGDGPMEDVVFNLTVAHKFRFRAPRNGNFSASAGFMPQGGFALTARKPSHFFDAPGTAVFRVILRLEYNVISGNTINFVDQSIVAESASARSYSASTVGNIESNPLEHVLTGGAGNRVEGRDTVEVRAIYQIHARANDGAGFNLDFASVPEVNGDPGDGLNAPFALIRIF